MSLYYQYEQMSTRLKSYAIATVFVFLVSFIGSNKQFFNVESVFKFLNHEFNPIQDGHFWDCFQMGEGGGEGGKRAPLPKICHTHLTMIQLGSYTLPKEDPKNI